MNDLHEKAVELARQYTSIERELIGVIQGIDEQKLFREHACTSLFRYCHKRLGFSESISYALIAVSRKARIAPSLRIAIEEGEITLSQAKRITSVITEENSREWIHRCMSLTQKQLEKEVARAHPKSAVRERARYVTAERLELKLGVSEELMDRIKRVQDLESQRSGQAASLEEALHAMTNLYLEKRDPVRRAEKASRRSPKPSSLSPQGPSSGKVITPGRAPIAARIRHEVQLRDQGQCRVIQANGERCPNRRWLHLHHIQPVSQGGLNTVENLITLCSSHHGREHAKGND